MAFVTMFFGNLRSKWRCVTIKFLIHIWQKNKHNIQYKHLMPAVKHSSGGILIWTCFETKGLGQLAVMKSTMGNGSVKVQTTTSNVAVLRIDKWSCSYVVPF